MNKEEAKKMGVTHYIVDEDNEVFYFKFDGFDVFQYIDGWRWIDNIRDCPKYYSELKPL